MKIDWKAEVIRFMDAMGFDAPDMARLCHVSKSSVDSWRVGRSRPREKREEQLLSMFSFLLERRRGMIEAARAVAERVR